MREMRTKYYMKSIAIILNNYSPKEKMEHLTPFF